MITKFNEDGVSKILNKDGTVNYYAKILPSEEANQYFDLLMQNILWGKKEVIIFGKHITTKRKVAWQVLNKNHTGLISIGQIAKDPVFLIFMHLPYSLLRTNNTKAITNAIVREFGPHDSISIDKQLDPLLKKCYENATALNLSKCNNAAGCPVLFKSHFSLMPT